MFAEELSGNASRKRQEKNRERRRQIKQQQRQSASAAAIPKTVSGASQSTSSSAAPLSQDNAKDIPSVTEGAQEVTSSLPPPVAPSQPATDSKQKSSSAVTHALEQRQIRQEVQRQQRATTVIQSIYRSFLSNRALIESERIVLKKRISDIITLRTVLKKAGNKTDYVPPPATASSLVRQLLFVTRVIPYRNGCAQVVLRCDDDMQTVHQVLKYVLLPGMLSSDENLDPILPWLSSSEGRVRFLRLLRLCLVCGTSRTVTPEILASVDAFMRAALGVTSESRGELVRPCRSLLLSTSLESIEPSASKTKPDKHFRNHVVTGTSLDLLRIVRTHLMYHTGGSLPIPPDASKMRESCISQREREHADVLFRLALDAVLSALVGSEGQALQRRFVAEILTVPLLTWRISPATISKLLAAPPSTVIFSKGSSSTRTVLFICFLSSFVESHASELSEGQVASVLPSVDIREIPATPAQVLLANLIQIGRICPSINGSGTNPVEYRAGAFFFSVLATLIDVVPLGTFSSRQSAVEWISDGKSHHTPIVLSPVIIDQCKLILVDSFVRNLFNCAIDNSVLHTEGVLMSKNDKDIKHEKELADVGTSSAASLAAKEARVDRTQGFWQSSKWARKLSTSVSKMLTGDSNSDAASASKKSNGPGMLVNTSSVARQLAHGRGPHDRHVTKAFLASNDESSTAVEFTEKKAAAPYSPELLYALSRMYGIVLSRWGGVGKDTVKRGEETRGNDKVTSVADPITLSLLNVICFSTDIVKSTWSIIQSDQAVISDLYSVIDAGKRNIPIRSLKISPLYSTSQLEKGNGVVLLYLFVCSLSHVLIVTDDVEIHDMDQPIPLHQIRRCIQLLKKLLYRACCVDNLADASVSRWESNYFGLSLISSSSKLMRDLYDRSSRRPLCVPKLFIVDDLLDTEIRRCKKNQDYVALLSTPVLKTCPFLVSYKRRLKLFERIVSTNRKDRQGGDDIFNQKPGIPVRIMRGRVLEDGLLTLNKLGRNLRERIIVQYLNEAGTRETGVDAGGLFKEFWTDLSALAFDPNYALFKETEGAGNCLYPNPSSKAAHGPDHISLFEFLGRILGKALYEGITIHPQFAHLFLSFLRGDYNYLHMLPDLSTMDPQLYNNLMFLKTYEGDASDLCLTFTVANDDFGNNKEVPLIPNGQNIDVTNANKQRYIGLVAKHHVCDRLREQSEAFTRGLWDVIDRSWLCLFNEPELQVLISGSTNGKIDVADMRSNTRYIGGYTGLDRTINRFWKVVASFNSKQQSDLLRFVTSCARPPPLGFSNMNPPFTIQRVNIFRDGKQLPTSSTCFNTLKLPTYSSEKVLRERLLYAIESGAGFELT